MHHLLLSSLLLIMNMPLSIYFIRENRQFVLEQVWDQSYILLQTNGNIVVV